MGCRNFCCPIENVTTSLAASRLQSPRLAAESARFNRSAAPPGFADRGALSIATAAWPAMLASRQPCWGVNTPTSEWPKKSPPSTSPSRPTTGKSQVACGREMAFRHAEVGSIFAVTRIFRNIIQANNALASERGAEHVCVSRHGKARKGLTRDARQGVERRIHPAHPPRYRKRPRTARSSWYLRR